MSKIALCFLTYGNLSKPQIWRNQLNLNDHLFSVYIHSKDYFTDNVYNFDEYIIPNKIHDTYWGEISLVKATLRLFQEAYLDDRNIFFILLSDKCIPLKPLREIYDFIIKLNNNIINETDNNCKYRYYGLNRPDEFKYDEFKKQSQWMILKRSTVSFFLNNLKFLDYFGNTFECPDEHFFINFCNKFKIKFINQKITYCKWNRNIIEFLSPIHPQTYESLSNSDVFRIINNHPTCLFIRKISKKCKLGTYFNDYYKNKLINQDYYFLFVIMRYIFNNKDYLYKINLCENKSIERSNINY